MMIEYYCKDCYKKPGALKRYIDYEKEYDPKQVLYCILCAEPMEIYTGVNDEDLEGLKG